MAHEQRAAAPHACGTPIDTDLRRELTAIAGSLANVAHRLDAAEGADAVTDGLAVMALDQACQAVHLALLEVRHWLSAA